MMIQLIEISLIKEMKNNFDLIQVMYPDLSFETYERMLHEMLPNQYFQLIAIQNNQKIGLTGFWINTKLWSGKYLEIDHFVIAPDFRSSGVGSKMVAYLEEKAKREYCKMITLDAYTNNFKAHKFFYNQGFIPKGFHFLKEI